MSGRLGGVQALIKASYPYAHFIHCYAHQLNLIMERSVSANTMVRNFFANLRAFPVFFSRSAKRTDILKEIVNRKIPSAPTTRWNFNIRTVTVVHTYREQLNECMEHILESVNLDADTINQAGMLLRYLNDDNFNYWLDFFAKIMPHCDILFKQLQSRSKEVLEINKDIEHFTLAIQNIWENNTLQIQPTKKRRPNDLPHSVICHEVCDTIVNQAKDRFEYHGHLVISKLFFSEKFRDYHKKFPIIDFNTAMATYDFIDKLKLKNELIVLYSREDFYVTDGALSILQLFTNNNLLGVFSESVKLLQIICTIPMTSVESERCFSTLKRIKSFMRNTMSQDRLNALAMLSIEKKMISSMSDFNIRVIDVFSRSKNRRMDFLHK
jgi:hypothetical protein